MVGGRGRGQGKGRGRGRGPPGAAPEPGAGARKATGSRWSLASLVHRQAADALARLLAASASRRGGTSIKALTLAPHIQAKKATYAVTHETLRCETVAPRTDTLQAIVATSDHLFKLMPL